MRSSASATTLRRTDGSPCQRRRRADREAKRLAGTRVPLFDVPLGPLQDQDHVLIRGFVRQDDELVAAEPGDEIGAAEGGAQHARRLEEQAVAGLVAQLVVHALEAVHVREQQQAAGAAALQQLEPLVRGVRRRGDCSAR
jgi:hypothetical protein